MRIQPEPDGMVTVVIEPQFPWPGHQPGQYVRIGAEINGIRHWRAYSLTSDPGHPEGLVSITVKVVEGRKMSPFLGRDATPGASAATVRYLARRGTYSIARARHVLGYEPTINLGAGMQRTETWLREQGML